MLLLDEHNTADYLRRTGRVTATDDISVTWLAGGVSNVVLRIAFRDRPDADFILKQARDRLRVADPWFCSVERIWRETAVLRVCAEAIGGAAAESGVRLATPQWLWEDREQYAYAMSAAPAAHGTWKDQLLAGDARPEIGAAVGTLLGMLHARTWLRVDLAETLGDRTFFDDLRLDPYYRQVARIRPELAGGIEVLLEELANCRVALVHGDFSPKNLLVGEEQVTLLDFEVGHFGDPAFDLGFFFAHLVLKQWRSGDDPMFVAVRERAWRDYARIVAPAVGAAAWNSLRIRAARNLGACLAARVDGKSKVDYLTPSLSERARVVGAALLLRPAENGTAWFS